jgi:hypothetical protein
MVPLYGSVHGGNAIDIFVESNLTVSAPKVAMYSIVTKLCSMEFVLGKKKS